jgi:hypothetical protein
VSVLQWQQCVRVGFGVALRWLGFGLGWLMRTMVRMYGLSAEWVLGFAC